MDPPPCNSDYRGYLFIPPLILLLYHYYIVGVPPKTFPILGQSSATLAEFAIGEVEGLILKGRGVSNQLCTNQVRVYRIL